MASGSYEINGVLLTDQPTVGRWIPRETLGVDGTGHPVYPALRSFEMSWELISPDGFEQIYRFFRNTSGTRFMPCNLPTYAEGDFVFRVHQGCVINEPQFGDTYFAEDGYIPNVRLLITNITSEPT